MIYKKEDFIYAISFVFLPAAILFAVSYDFFFFWDSVQLASRHAHWFYEHNCSFVFLHPDMDSGHIPFWGYYLAFVWLMLGKSLLISHLSVIPWLLMYYFFLWKISARFSNQAYPYLLNVLLILEPVMLAQSVLVSPDIMLMASFLAHWYFIETQKFKWRSVSASLLVLVSLRGVMVLIAMELYLAYISHKEQKYTIVRNLFYLLPAITIILYYQFAHYLYFSWIGWHSESPWSDSFSLVYLGDFLRNHIIFAWRILDYGRWIVWFLIFILMIRNQKTVFKTKLIWILLFCFLLIFYPISMPRSGLMAHRYFLPISLISVVLFYQLWQFSERASKRMPYLVIISFVTAHFWIYPAHISQGWDATLAHIPYYELKKEMNSYIKDNHLDIVNIGSDFPDLASGEIIFLDGEEKSFKSYSLESDSLLIYSNIFNNFTDNELNELVHWQKWHVLKKNGIEIILYKK